MTWALTSSRRSRISRLVPLSTAMATINDATPRATPPREKMLMTEMNVCLRLDLRYRQPIKVSRDTAASAMVAASYRPAGGKSICRGTMAPTRQSGPAGCRNQGAGRYDRRPDRCSDERRGSHEEPSPGIVFRNPHPPGVCQHHGKRCRTRWTPAERGRAWFWSTPCTSPHRCSSTMTRRGAASRLRGMAGTPGPPRARLRLSPQRG